MLNQFYDKYILTSTLRYTHSNFFLVNIPFAIVPTEILLSLAGSDDLDLHKKIYSAIKQDTRDKLIKQLSALGVEKKKQIEFTKSLFMYSGWGTIDIIDLQLEGKKAIVVVKDSPLATSLKGKAKNAVDIFLRGVLAGVFAAVFEENIDCVEVECEAIGSERCKFIIKPQTEFDVASAIVQAQLQLV